jgi:hypothetical protein
MRHIIKFSFVCGIASIAIQACAEPTAPQAPRVHQDTCSGGGSSDWDLCITSDTTH